MTYHRPIVVGTRGSTLALRQTQEILGQLRAVFPRQEFTISIIRTGGDRDAVNPLATLGRGIFVKELEGRP